MSAWTRDRYVSIWRRIRNGEQRQDIAASEGMGARSLRDALSRPLSREVEREVMAEPRSGAAGSPSIAPPVAASTDQLHRRLADLCRRGPQSLEALCDALDLAPRRARQLVAEAQAAGYTVAAAGDTYALKQPEETAQRDQGAIIQPTTGETFWLGACSDLHFGSKYCLRAQLREYAETAHARGVRTFVVAGDILDGCYRHGVWELSHHGWDEQAADAFESLPRLDGANWYFIDGNHDETFWGQTGAISGARLEDYFRNRGRTDLHYLGARSAFLSLSCSGVRRPVRVEAWHPRSAPAYAMSYHLQKRVESYAPGTKPDILIGGHWHYAVSFNTRGVHAMAPGCFQSPESSFSRSLTGGVANGGYIVDWKLTKDGTLREVGTRFVGFYHAEQSRALELAAS